MWMASLNWPRLRESRVNHDIKRRNLIDASDCGALLVNHQRVPAMAKGHGIKREQSETDPIRAF